MLPPVTWRSLLFSVKMRTSPDPCEGIWGAKVEHQKIHV